MSVQTRSMTRALFAKDTSMAPLKIDVFEDSGNSESGRQAF